jgi:asparagine synthase (glutamine-hydrolysing)
MCGIAGIIQFGQLQVDPGTLERMSVSLKHRGPDGYGSWIDDDNVVGLAHRRLAIVDPHPRSTQPMHLNDRYVLVFNGEIYNHAELRKNLQKQGITFQTENDAEVLLQLFALHGRSCLEQLDGMFAFAIWDRQTKTLFAARDRFGEKPFYFHHNDECLLFASEMKALFAAGINQAEDSFLAGLYLTTGILKDPSDQGATFFKHIRSLPPAHSMVVSNNIISIERYWDLSFKRNTHQDIFNQLDQKLNDAVHQRLGMNVKCGIGISGGLDSSTLLYYLLKQHAKIDCLSAIFPGFERNEEVHVKTLANTFSIEPIWVSSNADMLTNQLDQWLYHQEEPVSSSSAFAQYLVYERAKASGIRVMFEGQGADEVFAGYDRFVSVYLRQFIQQKKFRAFQKQYSALKKSGTTFNWNLNHLAAGLFPSIAKKIIRSRKIKSLQADWLNDDYRDFLLLETETRFPDSAIAHLHDALKADLTAGNLEVLLRYADRNAMAHGIEVRLPFLQTELVEWVYGLPDDLFIHQGQTKWILRQTMKNKLPNSITHRTDKVAFETPQAAWMKNASIQDRIHDAKNELIAMRWLDKKILKRKLDQLPVHAANNIDWQILCLASTRNAMRY